MPCQRSAFTLTALLVATMLQLLSPAPAKAQQESVLYSFTGTGGGVAPKSPLIFDSSGNLYGTTYAGGSGGTVFKMKPKSGGGWTETTLHSFGGAGDGSFSAAGLVMDTGGNLYGTTTSGGAHNSGTVFVLKNTKTGWVEKTIHSFNNNGKDGVNPDGGLILDSSGNLSGTTTAGGANFCSQLNTHCGTVFELIHGTIGGWSEKILHNFKQIGDTDGFAPLGNLVFDTVGNLYGTTSFGGPGFEGTVFELVPRTNGAWGEKVLYGFGSLPDGVNPAGGLVFDFAGNLYGVTPLGGSQSMASGTVFELSPGAGGTWTKSTLYSFGQSGDAAAPQGNLLIDAAGNLFGASESGGVADEGTVFKLAPAGNGVWNESLLYSFTGFALSNTDAATPNAGLVFDSAGNLYGTSSGGGESFVGTVFEVTP